MAYQNYLNFDLVITRGGDDWYRAIVDSPKGPGNAAFSHPFTSEELEEFLAELNNLHDQEGAREAIKRFGGALFQQVFNRELYSVWTRNLDETSEEVGLRLRLRLVKVPELENLPWEYLYDESRASFLSASPRTPVIRYLDVARPSQRPLTRGPLKLLVLISNPIDEAQLDVEREWQKLNEALGVLERTNKVKLVALRGEQANLLALQDVLQREPIHVLHFIGHGAFDDETGGYLLLQGEGGRGHRVTGEDLNWFLTDQGLRLVVLNACEGARALLDDPFAGVAQALYQGGVPAVVAMRMGITDDAAVAFSRAFYGAISNYYPVDSALAEARKAMRAQGSHVEWATPCLYLSSSDARLLQEIESDRPVQKGHFDEMIEAFMDGKVAVFVGPAANVSGEGHPPDDLGLAASLRNGASCELGSDWGLPRVSQYVENARSREFLTAELRASLRKASRHGPVHKFLAALPSLLRERGSPKAFPLIVTGNYDNAIERAFLQANDGEGEPHEVLTFNREEGAFGEFYHTPFRGAEQALTPKKRKALQFKDKAVILKVRGAVDGKDRGGDGSVVTEDNYISFPSSRELDLLLPDCLKGRLRESHLLFLGWNLSDWNYRVILDRLWRPETPISWVVLCDRDDEQFWRRRRVRILDATLDDWIAGLTGRLQ